MTKALENLYSKREQLLNKGKSLNVETDYEAFVSNNAEIKKLDQMIEAQEEFEANEKETAAAASSASNGKNGAANNKKLFTSFSEQLRAIVNAGRPNGAVDPRLIRDDEKSDGTLNTTNNPDGGYAIQSDFLGNILEKAYERSPISPVAVPTPFLPTRIEQIMFYSTTAETRQKKALSYLGVCRLIG